MRDLHTYGARIEGIAAPLPMLPEETVRAIMADVSDPATSRVSIDVERLLVKSRSVETTFDMSERHRRMFLEGLDMIGATLAMHEQIQAFQHGHWAARPW